jgi:hypothetical protein
MDTTAAAIWFLSAMILIKSLAEAEHLAKLQKALDLQNHILEVGLDHIRHQMRS